jgi:hypothetical protein
MSEWTKRTGYKMAEDREVGYRGNKFDKKCFQRQLREKKDDGRPKMTLEELHSSEVREIDFRTAQDFILDFEWLGTMGTTKFSYGLYTQSGDLFAVYCFGLTAGTQVLSQPFGEEHKSEGIVLVRGACAPFAHEHASSYGIGRVIPFVRDRGYKFVVAYSDVESGEIGTVYQATNWYFYGMTSPVTYLVRPDLKRVDPKIIHKYAKKKGITRQEQVEEFMAEGYVFEKANPKLKYIKLIGNKRDNKELMKKKRFNIYPYMKRQDDMENVLVEAKKTIKELDRRKANEEKN